MSTPRFYRTNVEENALFHDPQSGSLHTSWHSRLWHNDRELSLHICPNKIRTTPTGKYTSNYLSGKIPNAETYMEGQHAPSWSDSSSTFAGYNWGTIRRLPQIVLCIATKHSKKNSALNLPRIVTGHVLFLRMWEVC